MEIMCATHFPSSRLTAKKLEKHVSLNGEIEGLEFRLPTFDERLDNMSSPWISFFEKHIE